MDSLSFELLVLVTEHLDHRAHLNFSLINRRCRSAALPRILSTITIAFDTSQELDASVSQLTSVLASTANHNHVRHLKVIGADLQIYYDPEYEGLFARPPEYWSYARPSYRLPELWISETQWQPLGSLVEGLPMLKDVTWATREQIPLRILRHLHTMVPRCRLHMRSFHLQSLSQSGDEILKISSHDLELATSPCLYSLVRYQEFDGHNDHNEQAIYEMLAGGAPNLKEVFYQWFEGGQYLAKSLASRKPRQAWQPGTIEPSADSVGRLESLAFKVRGYGIMRMHNIRTDLSALRSLELFQYLSRENFDWLLGKSREFSGLQQLTIGWQRRHFDVSFFLALPALRSLCLYDLYDVEAMCTIIEHSSQCLRVLQLKSNFYNPKLFSTILDNCPYLEELGLNISRDAGSLEEVATYRSFGKLPALRTVALQLHTRHDFSEYRYLEPGQHQNLDLSDRHSKLRGILVDLAVDEALARSIFNAIASAKEAKDSPLESLELSVHVPKYEVDEVTRFLEFVGRSWRCTRLFDGSKDAYSCSVELLDPREAGTRESIVEEEWLIGLMENEDAPAVHDVWPKSRDIAVEDAWHSFPLSGGSCPTRE
ncbi:hypothetical protein AMS68_000400 [Peltaster fructicola]|uniref:F-box domain-containing protein n=1 Tax=Peltaster fructicola TaxID=286661 RepID=A0A6H0XJH6_9PEZI|nr:hypothetical protein AMS68_000400 [Peltaster fructicola]